MSARFDAKVVLVTGGTSGIGLAVAERVASEGARVVIAGRRKDVGEEVVAKLRAQDAWATFVRTDLTVEDEVAALVAATVSEFGRLDAAFNNVGGVNAYGDIQDVATESWNAELDHNLNSVFYSLKHQIPAMLANGGGAIVNNASNLGVVGMGMVAPYVAAKHAVVGLTRATALETAAQGVRVNAITSGGVDTPLFRASMGTTEEAVAHIASLHPMERIAQPEEIAASVAFLLSDEASFITGAALAIDGGFTAR
ncbi:SDR family NAD(P)-dependent oxidoreductase [Yinghuangia seranimata]|uniref:SDR family NAD(P)-dependent oxidoreductase n=1 Tax=Yinghuangia seranimata TaxID=408067 RepID=UPI00248BDC45|nr:glucose 1-dehydrogenase [Yinghuangia seranimata]MDI2130433.1 glucose 1-dehydrogenase [Yinghuangia seranimata]